MRMIRMVGSLALAVLVAGGVSLAAAPSASADQTWVQSFQRSGPEAPCNAPKELDITWQDGWGGSPEWTPTWEQWPNNGQGGWTCTRSITWAKDYRYPSAGCIRGSVNEWVQFNGGWSLPLASPVYSDTACANLQGPAGWSLVYAPVGYDATVLCLEAFGAPVTLHDFGFSVYGCRTS